MDGSAFIVSITVLTVNDLDTQGSALILGMRSYYDDVSEAHFRSNDAGGARSAIVVLEWYCHCGG